MSNFVHKIKDTFTNDKQSGDSPYGSNVTNNPRDDSNRGIVAPDKFVLELFSSVTNLLFKDYSAATGGVTGDSYGTDSATSTYGSRSANAGPHSSNVANKLDPRADSGIGTGPGRNRQRSF